MAARHGDRAYFSVLLAASRGELLIKHAEDIGEKPSAVIRNIVYKHLQQINPEAYTEAEELDNRRWKETVKARSAAQLEGRLKSQWEKLNMSNVIADETSDPLQSDQAQQHA